MNREDRSIHKRTGTSHRLLVTAVSAALALTAMGAEGATVAFDDDVEVTVGEQFTITLAMDFTDEATLGGGVDVLWDPQLLELVSWDPIAFGDPDFGRVGDIDAVAGFVDGFAFGDFNGLEGPADVATITFVAFAAGSTSVMPRGDDTVGGMLAGCFVSAVTFQCQSVSFGDASVVISDGAVVPLPSAAWLLLSALGTASGLRLTRRRLELEG
ncbi:MAG: hypothetical protein AAGA68_22480 [Pseudomonadota bacterium]